MAARVRTLLPAAWLGALLTIALLAAPAAFATLGGADAGRLVARLFAREAPLSLFCGLAVVLLERRRAPGLGTEVLLALGAVFCTLAGYYALQPLMAQARAASGSVGFGALHAASLGLYGVKLALVAALAWRAASGLSPTARAS